MPNKVLVSHVCVSVITIRTMAAATFATITTFKVVLLGKDPISLFRKIIIALFQGNPFLHALQDHLAT